MITPGETFGAEHEADAFTPRLPVGSLFDHQSGRYVRGIDGEMVLNAGLPATTAIVGGPNQFKSTVADFMGMAAEEYFYDFANLMEYETESDRDYDSMLFRAQQFARIKAGGVYADPKIYLTNKSKILADDYWDMRKQFGEAKLKGGKKAYYTTPMISPDGNQLKILQPTIEIWDSFSKSRFTRVEEKYAKADIDSKDRNMNYMNDGLIKDRVLNEMTLVNSRTGMYGIMTGHVGEKHNLDPNQPPSKVLANLQAGNKIKGCPEQFLFMPNNMWYCHSQKAFLDPSGIPMYGRGEAGAKYDKDLVEITIMNLRGKFGSSGLPFKIIASQTMGVQGHLSQFHYIREANKYYGMESGDNQRLRLDFCPDIMVQRNGVRDMIDQNYRYRRAIELISGLAQIKNTMWYLGDIINITPMQIFTALKERGYDWDILLGETRYQWMPTEIKSDKHYLSSLDLLRMYTKEWSPSWLGKPRNGAK